MYRCVALLSLREPGVPAAASSRARRGSSSRARPGATFRACCSTAATSSEAIRTPEVSAAASVLAADPAVRAALLEKQRALIASGDWVAEGRDIGTVVAPQAPS